MKRALICIVAGVLLSASLIAQVSPGVPPFSSVTSGPDVTNLGNLNVHFTIPIFHKPGRGLPFSYDLAYDTSVWYPVGVSGSQSWQPVYNWGWTAQTQVAVGFISYNMQTGSAPCNPPYDLHTVYYTVYSNFVYHDAFGRSHSWNIATSTGGQGCPTLSSLPPQTYSGMNGDGSGLTLGVNAYSQTQPSASVTTSGGEQLNPPLTTNAGPGTAIDSNGNAISVDGSGNFTDTLGTTALAVNSNANPVTLTYTDSNNNPEAVKVYYAPYTVQTWFQCGGISEYGPTSVSLVDHIQLPDNSTYVFHYEPTPNGSGNFTGRLASITLPTGAVITYTFPVANDGVICSDGSTAGFNRQTPDGTTTYSRTNITGTEWQTSITDPYQNLTQIWFQTVGGNFYETKRQINQRIGSNQVSQRIVETCYNGAAYECTGSSITLPITSVAQLTILDNNWQSQTRKFFDSLQRPIEFDEYDFGPGGAGAVLRKTLTSYASLGNDINDRVANVTVQDGNGNQQAYTSYGYDESALTTTSGVPQHVAVSGSRGNLTSINQWVNSPLTTLTTTMKYDDTGNVVSTVDPNGQSNPSAHTTSFSYSNANAYVSQVAFPDTGSTHHITSSTYDNNTGLVTSTTDQNGRTTTFSYDSMLRPLSVVYPDGGETDYSYIAYSLNRPVEIHAQQKIDSTPRWKHAYIWLDMMGRTFRTAVSSGESSGYDQQDTCYDPNGRAWFTSYPYQGGGLYANSPVCSVSNQSLTVTANGDTYAYDALNRQTSGTHSDGSSVISAYNGRALQVQDEGNGNGSTKVTRILQNNSLGQLTGVCEVSGSTLLGNGNTPASCGLDYGGTGYLTSYGYDTLGNLKHVDQGGYTTRTYVYDSLSRLTSATDPESGTTSYTYDGDSNVVTRVRPTANQTNPAVTTTTTYYYDALNRPTGVSYSDGTTGVSNFYDETSIWGVSPQNPIGRLTHNSVSGASADILSYDPMGRLAAEWQCTPLTCGTGSFYLSYGYDYLGDLTSLHNGLGFTLGYTYNTGGRLTGMTNSPADANHPGTLLSGLHYNAFGEETSGALGDSVSGHQTINESMGFNSRGFLSSKSSGSVYSLSSVNYAPNGKMLSANENINGTSGTWTYTYDEFNRITTAIQNGGANLTWDYDRFGNRWHQNSSPQYSFTGNGGGNNNHIDGYQYDAAGNMINDTFHSYTYDAEGRMTAVDGGTTASYQYDGFGRRVTVRGNAGTYDFVFYPNGHWISKLHYPDGGVWWDELYAGDRHVATFANGSTYFTHTDWLGSARVRTDPFASVISTCTSWPFGDNASCTGTDWSSMHYTGDEHDSEDNTEHTQFRQLSTAQGRWLSPDPYMGSMDLTNPQSLNRYSYVMNNPLNSTDPLGLDGNDCNQGDRQCDKPPATENAGMDGTGERGCSLDGIDIGCGFVGPLLNSGAAAVCPNNDCFNVVLNSTGPGQSSWYRIQHNPFLTLNCNNYNGNAQESCLWSSTSLVWIADVPMGMWGQAIFHGPGMRNLWAQSSNLANAAAVGTAVVPVIPVALGELGTSAVGDKLIGEAVFNPATNQVESGILNSWRGLRYGWSYYQYGIAPTATGVPAGMYVLRLSSGAPSWPWWIHFPYPF